MYTGNEHNAESGSNLEIKIYGTEGNTARIRLQGNFRRDTYDTMTLHLSIGEPYKITVYSSGPHRDDGWYLGWVRYYIYFSIIQAHTGCLKSD